MKIEFWMEDGDRATALAIGAAPQSIDMEACDLQIGDTISFAGFPLTTYQVAARHYLAGEQQWQLQLVPTGRSG